MHTWVLLLLLGTPDAGTPRPKKDRCTPLPRAGTPCTGSGWCVVDWGTPGGHSTALWCRNGTWVREEERNLD
jgi:hypothetical protein